MLVIKNVSFRYSESNNNELNNINLKIKTGEKICLIGESGSGKTTLLKALNGLLFYDGEINFNSEILKKYGEELISGHEEIKLIDQHFDLHKNISVRDNLLTKLRPYTPRFQNSRIKKLVNTFQLSKIIDKKVEQLSGGEKQRVAIANALTTIPKVILLDEPFNNLDFSLRKKAMDFLDEEIKEFQSTAILVSHRPDEIITFANSIIVIRKGKIIQKGSPEDVFFKPKTEYTAGMLGEYNLTEEVLNEAHRLNGKSFFRPIESYKYFSKTKLTKKLFLGDKYRFEDENSFVYYSTKIEEA